MKTLKTILKTLLITVLTLSFYNCSKSDDGDNQVPEQNIRVKTYGINSDEYNLTYNSDGKLSGYQFRSVHNNVVYNAANKIIQNGGATYTYNAQGKMATITRILESYIKESEIIYNNAGLIAQLNSIYTNNSTIYETSQTTIQYNSNNNIERIIERHDGAIVQFSKAEFIYDGNNNLAQQNISISSNGITYSNIETTSYTYDNKLNPNYNILTKTGITSDVNLVHIIHSTSFGNYIAYQQLYYHCKNNVLTSTKTHSSGIATNQYSYSYNDTDYPISAEETYTNSTGESGIIYYNWTYETY